MALSDKAAEQRFIVVEKIELPEIKTKAMVGVLANFKKSFKGLGKNTILVLPRKDEKLVKSIRNIPGFENTLANSLNVADVITANSLLVLKESLGVIEKTYLKDNK